MTCARLLCIKTGLTGAIHATGAGMTAIREKRSDRDRVQFTQRSQRIRFFHFVNLVKKVMCVKEFLYRINTLFMIDDGNQHLEQVCRNFFG